MISSSLSHAKSGGGGVGSEVTIEAQDTTSGTDITGTDVEDKRALDTYVQGVNPDALFNVTGSFTNSFPLTTSSNTFSALNDDMEFTNTGFSGVGINISGTWDGTISFYASNDGTNYFSILALPVNGALISSTSSNGSFYVGLANYNKFKLVATAWSSGTANLSLVRSALNVVQQSVANVINYIVKTEDASDTVTYVGKAMPGSGSDDPVWQISKLETTGSLFEVEYADSTPSFDKVWDDRASYTYG